MLEECTAVVGSCPFNAELSNNTSEAEVEAAIKEIKDIVILSVVKSQEINWVFITQAEAYYREKSLDDVAQTYILSLWNLTCRSEKKERALVTKK
ncbi:hypothetical protein MFLAVUS_008705 [Mucor flavus]|uniref:Uncharacterized protein n=1 Tax=Mucor flavus TaxID=439312 RepID=A0ABP9Z7Y0_9FUNG